MIDLICDTLGLMVDLDVDAGEEIEFLIVDVLDDFTIGFQRVCVFRGKAREEYYVFLRIAKGSRNAPLSWACFMAWANRCVQPVLFIANVENI